MIDEDLLQERKAAMLPHLDERQRRLFAAAEARAAGHGGIAAVARVKDKRSFEIDAGKLAEEAQFDGMFVLRTNAKVTPLQAVLRYRDLLQVENLFLRTKAIMRTRPIFHSSDAAIRGHVFCSFLALAMQKHLDDLSRDAGVMPEWKELLRDLDRLQQVRLAHRGADWLVRTDATPNVLALFRHAHVALPPRTRQTALPKALSPSNSAHKRRGRPKRSATSPRISPQLT